MTRTVAIACGAMIALTLGAPARVRAQSQCVATHAVRYREHPEGGPQRDTGRVLETSGGASYGVSIDSRIDIAVDTACLRAALGGYLLTPEQVARAGTLATRLHDLRVVGDSLSSAMLLFAEANRAYAAAMRGPDPLAALQAVGKFERIMGAVNSGLTSAMSARLADTRQRATASAGEVRDAAILAVRPQVVAVLAPAIRKQYDFQALNDIISNEVKLAHHELDELPHAGLAMEIRAHLTNARGESTPIFLPGYNTAAVGPDTPTPHLVFAVSPEQAKLYAYYDSLAKSLKANQSLGDAVLAGLKQDLVASGTDVTTMIGTLHGTVDSVDASLARLQRWENASARDAWIASFAVGLAATPSGAAVIAKWDGVASVAARLERKVATARGLARTRDNFAAGDIQGAMNAVLGALSLIPVPVGERLTGSPISAASWRADVDTLDQFVKAVNALPGDIRTRLLKDGPVADLQAFSIAGLRIATTLASSSEMARVWLAKAFNSELARSSANRPDPPGQQRVALSADPNTSLNLRTIPVPRSEGDVVDVSYAFYADDRKLPGSWTDDLHLRQFGALGRPAAGLAFTRQLTESTWSPTAAISWMLAYHGWPSDARDHGLGSSLRAISLGFSTMSLNFDSAQKVEIGLGATLGLLDERILLGYGQNLQAASNGGFVFFSFRLFSASGSLGGP
jgi:hypothetical protein